jgi:hypothetical protein
MRVAFALLSYGAQIKGDVQKALCYMHVSKSIEYALLHKIAPNDTVHRTGS